MFSTLKNNFRQLLPKRLRSRLGYGVGIDTMAFDTALSIKEDIKSKYGEVGPLLDIFVNNEGYPVHKWHHYIPIYERYFSSFRGQPVRFLEIGVFRGGSLKMWREYFGQDAVIYGVDNDPQCVRYNGQHGEVRIGSQDDEKFLLSVVEEMGGVDIVLDDGSHQVKHLKKSFNVLFPLLTEGGIYMAEDLHTSYWRGYGGAYGRKSNFWGFVLERINDMHHWYHVNPLRNPALQDMCSSIHVHDSIAVFEKKQSFRPAHSVIP